MFLDNFSDIYLVLPRPLLLYIHCACSLKLVLSCEGISKLTLDIYLVYFVDIGIENLCAYDYTHFNWVVISSERFLMQKKMSFKVASQPFDFDIS